MNEFADIYSVERKFYKSFIEQLIPNSYRTEIVELSNYETATKIFSNKTGKCLCSRVTHKKHLNEDERQPEQYYIFEMPDDDERRAPIPKRQLHLNTREDVQAFFNILSKMQKEQNKND